MTDIAKVGVIGAGTMGSGIAQTCAVAGFDVAIVDVANAAVQRGLTTIDESLGRLLKKEKISADAKAQARARISGTTDYATLKSADLIIEAAIENVELKIKILHQVDALARPDALIASNTSSISITALAAAMSRPAQFLGMHFFNPVPLMSLVELIRGLQTSDETVASARTFVARLGKSPIIVKNSPGFVVNRILCPMINEAIFALQEGLATPEDIDNGMRQGCNHPIGPLALADMIGLDVMLAVMNVFLDGFNDPKYRPAPLLQEMVDAGYLGRKSGRGFYSYE